MPDFNLLEILGLGGTGLAVTAGVLGLFWKGDDAVSDEFRELVSKRLQGIKIESDNANWHQSFIQIFDRIFGKNCLAFRCFLRSCVASILTVVAIFSIFIYIHPDSLSIAITRMGESYIEVFVITFAFICFNLLPDYFSLVETRWVMGIMSQKYSVLNVFLFLMLDLLITVSIFCIVGGFLFFSMAYLIAIAVRVDKSALIYDIIGLLELFYEELIYRGIYLGQDVSGHLSLGVFFYSTLFTSVWVWLFVISWLFVIYSAHFQRVLAMLQFVLPIKTRPIRAIGEVAAVFTALGFVILAIIGFEVNSTKQATAEALVQVRP